MNLFITNSLTATLSLALVRVTLLLSLAWLSHLVLRNRNPRLQIRVWRATTLSIPLIVACSFILPGWGPSFSDLERNVGRFMPEMQRPLPDVVESSSTDAEPLQTPDQSTVATAKPVTPGNASELVPSVSPGSRIRFQFVECVVLLYVSITMFFALRLILQGFGLSRMIRAGSVAENYLTSIKKEICRRLNVTQDPAVIVSNSVAVPFATLIPRPVIVMPRKIVDTSSAAELELLIAHECCHFAGRDLAWSTAIQIVRTLFWFHPLTWGISEAHRFLCDVRCDAIACGESRSGYASMLARLALELQLEKIPSLGLAFVKGSETLRRVRLIQSGTKASPVSRSGKLLSVFAILIVTGLIGTFGVHGLVNQSLFDVDREELRSVVMTVQGPDGQPVAGAEIYVHGLRAVKEAASAHGNRKNNKATTNEKGEATVEYPRFVYEEMETGQLIFTISHPDFVPFQSQGESVSDPIKVTLDAGRRVQITAKDATSGARISERLFVIQPGGSQSQQWKMQEDGSLRSNALANSLTPLLVVCLREGQPALFSDLIHLETFPEGDCNIDDVPLSPGRVVKGQLSDNVPRPVTKGRIGLCAAASASDRPNYDNSIFWHDMTEIKDDGTFEFESVPREIDIQLIANCDGWVSESAPAEEIRQRFPYVTTDEHARSMRDTVTISQLFPSEGDKPIVLEMEQTATCEFNVTDQDGNAVPDAMVYLSPNAVWSPGPGGIVGYYQKTSVSVGLTIEQQQAHWRALMASADDTFRATTNAQGIALMKNVPGKRGLSASIDHKDLDLAPNDHGNAFFRHHPISVVPGEAAKIKLTVEPKSAVVIGR